MDQSSNGFLPSGTFIWETNRESFNLFCDAHHDFPEAVFKRREDYKDVYDDEVADFMYCSDRMTKTVRGYGTVVFFNENVLNHVKVTTSNRTVTVRKIEDFVDLKTIPGPKWMTIDGLQSWLGLRTASTMWELKEATFEDSELLEYFENFHFIPEIEFLNMTYELQDVV